MSGHGPRSDAWLLRLAGGNRGWVLAALGVLYPLAWVATIAVGGTQSAMPHAFYVPVLLAAVAFGAKAGLVAGLVAAVLCGPLMPIDTVTGEPQAMANWMTRGTFFVLVGSATGAAAAALHRVHGEAARAGLEHQLDIAVAVERSLRPSPEVEHELRSLLCDGGLQVVFQPIYSLDTGGLQAVEALARFDTRCPTTPDVWFERAERLGLGEQLELAVVELALDACATGLPEGVALSVNCGPETLRSAALPALIARHPGRPVVVEITEHVIIDDYPGLEGAIAVLRHHGVRLAVDDAGAGFASFRHIVRLGPDIIKLDLSLTQNVREDPVRRALAGAIVDFVDETGCELIAEGIEQSSDLATWSQLGASAAQGFLLARPGPLPAPRAAVPIPPRHRPVVDVATGLVGRAAPG